jgi:hypothetical protein
MLKKTMWLLAGAALLFFPGSQRALDFKEDPNPVRELVKRLELGRPISHGNLTVIPVHLDKIQDRFAYVTLETALEKGWITITEIEGGRVPQVKISNVSKHVIFLMGGEILTGCRQDRILANDILLAPGTRDLLAPVYCVEHGRWSATSGQFTSKKNLGTPEMRAKAQKKSPSAQSEIWAGIADQNRKMAVASPTEAYQEAFDKEENLAVIQKIEKKMKVFPRLHDDTVGVIIGLRGKLVSVDIFATPGLFAEQWPKILRSSALSSIGDPGKNDLDRGRAAEFLKSFLDRTYRRQAGLDLGFEYSSTATDAHILALSFQNNIVHLSAFPQEKDRVKVLQREPFNTRF